jgi:hypothetical protein
MKLLLNRRYKGSEYTIGSLSIDGEYFCDTLEDTDRGLSSTMSYNEITDKKVYGKTAIPTGVYNVSMNIVSSKFKNRKWAAQYNGKIPRLLNVIGFDGVLIHPGNTSDDTYGCILVGENKVKGMVINSQSTFKRLYQRLLEASSLTIEII